MCTVLIQSVCSFSAIADQLSECGWHTVDDATAPAPIIEGEPEIAKWVDGSGENTAYYQFRPATGFRALQLEGPDAEQLGNELRDEFPVSDLKDAERLMAEQDPASIVLGIQMVELLRGYALSGRVFELTEHADSLVAEQAARVSRLLLADAGGAAFRVLAEWKRANPEKSLVFHAIGDVWSKLQLLRWLIADQSSSRGDIDAVLRTALEDDDWEVRVTAIVCAARLRAISTLREVANSRLPLDNADGVNQDERRMLRSFQLAAIELLKGGHVPPDVSEPPTNKTLMHAHILRCIDGLPVSIVEKTYLYIQSLSAPLPDELPAPIAVPDALQTYGDIFQLSGSDLEFVWVPAIPHWLGEDLPRMQVRNPIRHDSPDNGYFISKNIVSDRSSGQAELHSYDSAREYCAFLSEDFDISLRLPTADQWEMAARGPDGRRFPWGNNARNRIVNRASPWGMEQAVGVVSQWTSTREGNNRITCGSPKQWMCAERSPTDPTNGRAAIRLVIEDS